MVLEPFTKMYKNILQRLRFKLFSTCGPYIVKMCCYDRKNYQFKVSQNEKLRLLSIVK